MVFIVYVVIYSLIYRFRRVMRKMVKKVDKWRAKNKYDIDWDALYDVIWSSVDFLIDEGIVFDFKIRKLIVMDIERVVLKLERGEEVKLLSIIKFNRLDNDLEIIDDLKEFKEVLNSEIYRETLKLFIF